VAKKVVGEGTRERSSIMKKVLALLAVLLLLGGYSFLSNRPKAAPPAPPRVYMWQIDMEKIEGIELRLPREGAGQSFVKVPSGDRFPWFFAGPRKAPVDPERWGGGIPLLLSGPGIERMICRQASEEKLTEMGLSKPQMEIALRLGEGKIVTVKVGDSTPDGHAYYVQSPYAPEVALVDASWFDVLKRLVKEPPYARSGT
jgi:hypothetical protein